MSRNLFDPIAIVTLFVFELVLVAALMRILATDPASAFFGGSLRKAATRLLRPAGRRIRWQRDGGDALGSIWARRWWILPPAALGVLALQIPITWGPLADAKESTEYLETLWVVVAASLGLSVAMVAFAFQAFMSTGRETHGGTLREFADETLLQDAIRLGVLSLLTTGIVLLHVGHDNPAGWAATWAILLSIATLVAVPYVVWRVIVSLDERQLLRMRARRLKATVERAMRHQLTEQAAEVVLQKNHMPIKRAYVAPQGGSPVNAPYDGEIQDVKLGLIARTLRRQGRGLTCHLAVSLGVRVDAGEPLLWLSGPTSEKPPRRLRRAVKINRDPGDRPDQKLLDQLKHLHSQGLDAATVGLHERWRQVADSYELVLLALPPASATFDVPFTGAVASPGFFGVGPLQRIQRYLFDEAKAAIKNDNPELVEAISYFPGQIARRAVKIGAPAIATSMLSLYPAMYHLAQERSQ